MKRTIRTLSLLGLLLIGLGAHAQRIGVGTNGLYWLTGSPNVDLQVRMSKSSVLSLEVMGRPKTFGVKGNNMKLFSMAPEVRYYFKKHGIQEHYIGLMADLAMFTCYWQNGDAHQGDMVGIGPVYGYDWAVGKRWNVGATFGLGCYFIRDHKSHNGKGANMQPMDPSEPDGELFNDYFYHVVPAPLRLGVTVTYFIR